MILKKEILLLTVLISLVAFGVVAGRLHNFHLTIGYSAFQLYLFVLIVCLFAFKLVCMIIKSALEEVRRRLWGYERTEDSLNVGQIFTVVNPEFIYNGKRYCELRDDIAKKVLLVARSTDNIISGNFAWAVIYGGGRAQLEDVPPKDILRAVKL